MDWLLMIVVALGGVGAGFINAVAGGGSALTLPILMIVGLDASVANGTNRVAVGIQSFTSAVTFHRDGVRPIDAAWRSGRWVLAGALVGALGAVQISADSLEILFGILFLVLAFVLGRNSALLQPSSRLGEGHGTKQSAALFVIGLYGGFFQAGVGIPLLLALINLMGLDAIRGNAAKSLIIFVYSASIIGVFSYAEQVDWLNGALLGFGGVVGSILGTKMLIRRGAGMIRGIVVVALVVAGLRSLMKLWAD
ncbi:MAG: sulfite exporter TauE/SafE family protein [Myxococcota bacterium]|nr:sulfite exporter TauE/SafE family protein [Myxococcota bacterium]